MTTNDVSTVLPEPVTRYLAAHRVRDADTAITAFTPDAVVVDDGRTYAGTEAIRTFLTKAAAEFTFTTTLTSAEQIGPEQFVAVHHVAGDFPGSPVDLRYRFALRDNLIASLIIEP